MPRSRRQKRKTKKQNKLKSKKFISVWWVVCCTLVLFSTAYLFWKLSNVEKFSYLTKTTNGDAQVVVFDPKNESVIKILIPADTQIELSSSLGVYRLKNAWELAIKEGLGGDLITRSIVKNFSIPVYYFKVDTDSNLDIIKKTKIWLLEKNIGKRSTKYYELTLTPTLKKVKLLDGQDGYKVVGAVPDYILLNFFGNDFGSILPKVEIVDATGDYQISDRVSGVLDVMGLKVSSYSKNDPSDFNCVVSGVNENLVKAVWLVFGCSYELSYQGESDIRIRLGQKFVDNF